MPVVKAKERPFLCAKKVIAMNFDELYKKINPKLKGIARKRNGRCLFIDEDDLYQEMCIYLWDQYKGGMPADVNESYIAKGCEFHILNYIRKNRDNASFVSMEQPLNDSGDMPGDVIAAAAKPMDELLDKEIVMHEIRNNGFSKKEKAVFFLLIEGRTAREVGRRLNISHVMVLKYKKKLIRDMRKVTKPADSLLM
ncbi:MAG: sigma-70 family RNA polymerase sigma factor [Candidatus Omnitrophota bacterium]|nr:sigma-70 family RNA polymerase sigma factor [Candidatus Omnitrophota bacterium]